MIVPPYKVAYMMDEDANLLYSNFFYTHAESEAFASKVRAKGGTPIVMVAEYQPDNPTDEQSFVWALLPGPNVFKIRTATFLTSPKFYVPLILGILIFLLLRKNNGLSRVVV